MNKQSDVKKVLEIFITAAVVLVVIQTLLYEFSRYDHWSVRSRNILLTAGFCFDLIFSIEFTVRSLLSRRKRGFLIYIKHERGWVDFLSSFPILIFDSAPSLFFLLSSDAQTGTGAIAAMNAFRALRITRLLRFAEILKISGKISYTGSKMTRHHISVITTTAVFTIVSVLLAFTFISGTSAVSFSKERSEEYIKLTEGLKRISDMNGIGFRDISESLLLADKKIIKIIYSNGTVVENISDTEFRRYYDEEDYISVTGKVCTLIVSMADVNKETALEHIKIFMIIIFIVLSFMILYIRHFVRNISDVAHILNMGFRKKDYNLLVKIPEEKADHEIFRLAKFYNEAYLPSKMKRIDRTYIKSTRSLSMKDLDDFKLK
jgi:hypothetical protein